MLWEIWCWNHIYRSSELLKHFVLRAGRFRRYSLLGSTFERPILSWYSTKETSLCQATANNVWWRHQMETFSALLAICAGNSPVPGEFPAQKPVTRSFDVFFDLRLNKRLSKQSRGCWFETLLRTLWRHWNGYKYYHITHRGLLCSHVSYNYLNSGQTVVMIIWNEDVRQRQMYFIWVELCYFVSVSNTLYYLLVDIMLLSQNRVSIIFIVKFEINYIAFTIKDSFEDQTN